ncbi:MAG: flagellar basal-body MS-ring/collar protein FliF [Proteobacteria bacterium]|nr:flagellar basal-body MS-ring/collar protein FliF [Pseudomonadota bacterium]
MPETNDIKSPVIGFLQDPNKRQLLFILGVAGIAAIVATIWLWSQEPEYRVLFSSFTDSDGGAIVSELQKINVPYKYAEGGGAILVPANRLHDVRLKLATQGLPKGGNVGFELMANQKMGTSQFLEQVNFQRALEGELARSIETISSIQGARVHLAMPKPSVFAREQQKPTASVLVTLLPGRTLDSSQVNAVVHLVASSVPDLAFKAVTVLDQNGNLLSEPSGTRGNGEPNSMQFKYIQSIQQDTVKRVESILTPILGVGNVRAEATVEVDFSESEMAAESYKPNRPPDASTIRSQQTSESLGPAGAPASGVPGALSNQPPNPSAALINNPPANNTASAQVVQGSSRKDSTVNYEVDKTVRYTQQPMGTIKRLAVAVVINYLKSGVNQNDQPRPLAEQETNQIRELVKEAMGYNKERGDSLSIVNSPFLTPSQEAAPEPPFWSQSDNIQLVKDMGRYAIIMLVLLFLYFRIVKPVLDKLIPPMPAIPSAKEIAGVDGWVKTEGGDSIPPVNAQEEARKAYQTEVAAVKKLANQDPKLIATVIQSWLGVKKEE